MANKRLWKSMKAGMQSAHGSVKWKVGEWYKTDGKIVACNNGFHASENVIDAMNFVNCEVLALVEVKGDYDKEDDKYVYEQMKIVEAWHWKKEDSVALSIFAAELCIENFEKKYPDDKRPREAIEAAKRWLENPTDENRSAARSAAWSAAESAAESAAWSARSAARSAESAARSATLFNRAKKKILKQCHDFVIKRTEKLEKYV